MKCNECGHEQHEGKFCGGCGGELIEVTTGQQESAATSEVTEQVATNESVEKVKEASKAFWAYFVHYLKQPAHIFSNRADEVKNGIISIVIAALFLALTFYNIIKFDFYGMGPSFLSVVGNTLFVTAVLIVVVIFLLFVVNKLLGNGQLSFADITSIYGAHMTPVIILNVAALLFALANSLVFASLLLMVSFLLILLIAPLYLISSLLTKHAKGVDPFYGYLIFIVASVITFSIVSAIFVDSILNQFFNSFI